MLLLLSIQAPAVRRWGEAARGEREWAHKVPMRSGAIEIWPVMDLSRFGYRSKTLTPAKATA